MPKRNRISISFKQEYRHVYEHLQAITNKSDYIAKAIQEYMSGNRESSINHEDIRKIVIEVLSQQGTIGTILNQKPPLVPGRISSEDVDLLSQLF